MLLLIFLYIVELEEMRQRSLSSISLGISIILFSVQFGMWYCNRFLCYSGSMIVKSETIISSFE